MLEGLDTIEWSSLTHAHGPATDVPEKLRSLLSEDEERRMEACAGLLETVWHQGTVYSASAAAVPFLVELLISPDVPDPGYVVALLAEIATGEGWLQYAIRVDGRQTVQQRLAAQGRPLDEALAEERAAMEAIHQGVAVGLRHLLPYLNDKEGLAAPVADALAQFREHASWLVPEVDAALASETDEHLRQVLAESKVRLLTGSPPREPENTARSERARWIFAHSRNSFDDGHRVVELLLDSRDVSELSSEELLLLAKGYNWGAEQEKAFETAKVGLAREPHSAEWLELAARYVRTAYVLHLEQYLAACDACIAGGPGPAEFWHLLKADQYIRVATGDRGLDSLSFLPFPVPHPELLGDAAEAMEAALACEPGLREQEACPAWVGVWNTRFAAVLQNPEYSHLAG